MTFSPCRTVVLVCLFTGLAGRAGECVAFDTVIGRFDFAYAMSGDAKLRPVQVFDDGVGKTYFQFSAGAPIPAVFAAQGTEMLLFAPQGPYQVVSSRARDFVLAMGMARARVTHAAVLSGAQPGAANATSAMPESPVSTSCAPSALRHEPPRHDAANPTHSSYATPLRGDVVQWVEPGPQGQQAIFFDGHGAILDRHARRLLRRLASGLGPHVKVQVVVRDDDSLKQDLWDTRAKVLRASLILNGIPPAHITVLRSDETGGLPARETMASSSRKTALLPSYIRWFSTGPSRGGPGMANAAATAPDLAGPSPSGCFVVHRSDAHIEAVLRRWGHASGYELRWDTSPVPVTADLSFRAGGFLDAVGQLVQSLQAIGHSLHVVIQGDRVVRIVAAD